MRVITVPVIDKPECAVALRTAFDLAELLSANVHGYHLIPHDPKKRIGNEALPFRFYTELESHTQLSKKEINQQSVNAQNFFNRLVDKNGFVLTKKARFEYEGGLAMWHEIKGDPEKFFSIAGPMSDLLVVTRPAKKSSRRAQTFMLSALMYSGRPVLILPQRKPTTVGKHVLIAWNQSMEAIAAISSILPLLQFSESVTVITAGSENRLGPKFQHLKQYLKHWDIDVKNLKTPGKNIEQEVVDTFNAIQADLLVMGAYSRNHWREKVFGGMTNHILYKSTIPTIMLHR